MNKISQIVWEKWLASLKNVISRKTSLRKPFSGRCGVRLNKQKRLKGIKISQNYFRATIHTWWFQKMQKIINSLKWVEPTLKLKILVFTPNLGIFFFSLGWKKFSVYDIFNLYDWIKIIKCSSNISINM